MPSRRTVDRDIAAVQRIDAVPRILAAVTQITGMRFAAVARVTESSWTACSVLDELGFGLVPGGELELETTICNEIREHHEPVIFGKASEHPVFSDHHTTKRYGLESYASVPIFRGSGELFGTLCAIDTRPADLESPGILKSLQLFAELIGMQLELVEDLDRTRTRLTDSHFREELLTATEREIRDLLQPLVTNMYLLHTSKTLSGDDRLLLEDMQTSCERVTHLLRQKLDLALARLDGGL